MKRSSISAGFLGIILCAGSVSAQPAIGVGGIVNNYSYIHPGLPNYGIAQGSIFDIFGTNLAVSSASQGVPLQTSLAGVSISVSVGGVTTQALPYFVTPLEIAAILPSKTPVGTGTITVTSGGQTSAPAPIVVVQSAFGLLTANQAGNGTAAAYDYTNNNVFMSPTTAANPGEYLVLWGSGLGPVTGDETVFQTSTDLTNIPIQVAIGGVNALVTYHGRSEFPGVDQINVVVPAGVSGCTVSLVVTASGLPSNYATIPVTASGRTCSDPGSSPISTSDWLTLSSLTNAKLGYVSLSKATIVTLPLTFLGVTVPGTTTTMDSAFGFFEKYSAAQLTASGFAQQASVGSCVVSTFSGTPSTTGVLTLNPLNAGPQINLNGPDGTLVLPLTSGFYTDVSSASPPAIIPPSGGTFTFDNGAGGPDVGAFTTTLNETLTTPLVWTNMASITSINRANGVQVTWTGGIPGTSVSISGASITGISLTSEFGAFFACTAPVSAGQFTVPAAVLQSLPVSGTISGFSLPGSLTLQNATVQKFSATGLDLGLASFSVEGQIEVPYN